MKLNPINESDYFYVLKNKLTKQQTLYHVNGCKIMPIDKKFCDDIVEFYKTGCYVKVDRGVAKNKQGMMVEKSYSHLFFDNNGRKILDLDEINEEEQKELFEIICEGHFDLEIENDAIKIRYYSIDGSVKLENRFSYSEMRGFLGINENHFFDSVKTESKSNS